MVSRAALIVLIACSAPPADARPVAAKAIGIAGPAQVDGRGETLRDGTIVIDGVPRVFWLRGPAGLDSPYTTLAIDRDGNGVAGPPRISGEPGALRKTREWDDPELIQLFEKTINVGAHSYDVSVAPRGDAVTLTPRANRLPDRISLRAGAPAPGFTIVDFDGHRVQLSALRGRRVLLDFWSTTCVQCIEALPQLAAIHRRHPDLEILGIAGDTADDLRAFLASQPHVGRIALDDDQVSEQYRVGWWPTYFLLGADGTIAISRGSLDDVAAVLDGRK